MHTESHSLDLASIAIASGAQYRGRLATNVSYLDTIKITMKRSKFKSYPAIQSARTKEIIDDWRTYLSQECVETMVRLNWHHTTR